jgi:DNA-directed RNA polymerase subunit beta'
MAVHLPLSAEAQAEARILMLSSNNILSPAHGRPLTTPTQDMVLGGYYLTYSDIDLDSKSSEDFDPRPKRFASEEEVERAVEDGQTDLQQPIEYRWNGELVLTTPGRVIFNEEVDRSLEETMGHAPEERPFINRTLSKKEMDTFISSLADRFGAHVIAGVLDKIKALGFHYATKAGITVSKNDIVIPQSKEKILAGYEERVSNVEQLYERGLITEEERHEQIVNLWTEATEDVAQAMEETLYELNPIFMMANSGARGSFKQIRQLAGMRGLMANPKGEIIERPIKANFMEGLSVLEYFISTHGARKGLADTALRTADSGYLTRRLVDVSQDVIISEHDCGTLDGIEARAIVESGEVIEPLRDRIIGRTTLEKIVDPFTSEKIIDVNEIMDEELSSAIQDAGIEKVKIRSVLTCTSRRGVCAKCYGRDLATGKLVELGQAVGVIAAQ